MEIVTIALAISVIVLIIAVIHLNKTTAHKLNLKHKDWFDQFTNEEQQKLLSIRYEQELAKTELIREQEQLKLYHDTQQKILDQDIELTRKEKMNLIEQELIRLDMEQKHLLSESLSNRQKEFEGQLQQFNLEQERLQNELAELKAKRDNTLSAIKEEEKLKTEIDFYRLILNSSDIEDVRELRSIEKHLHNKDVLRKLIYKTYIETPMNLLFSRIGIKESAGIYKITNVKNQMCYIGQSTNVKNRVKAHIQASLGISSIASQLVHDKMAEEGLENFTFQLIEECPKDKLNVREKYWIEYYDSSNWGYNKTGGGARA